MFCQIGDRMLASLSVLSQSDPLGWNCQKHTRKQQILRNKMGTKILKE